MRRLDGVSDHRVRSALQQLGDHVIVARHCLHRGGREESSRDPLQVPARDLRRSGPPGDRAHGEPWPDTLLAPTPPPRCEGVGTVKVPSTERSGRMVTPLQTRSKRHPPKIVMQLGPSKRHPYDLQAAIAGVSPGEFDIKAMPSSVHVDRAERCIVPHSYRLAGTARSGAGEKRLEHPNMPTTRMALRARRKNAPMGSVADDFEEFRDLLDHMLWGHLRSEVGDLRGDQRRGHAQPLGAKHVMGGPSRPRTGRVLVLSRALSRGRAGRSRRLVCRIGPVSLVVVAWK